MQTQDNTGFIQKIISKISTLTILSRKIAMRSKSDRIRHVVAYEITGLLIIVPLGSFIFGKPIFDMGMLTIIGSVIASGWNYLYNLGFDHLLERLTGNTHKSAAARVGHAVMFEAGLKLMLPPVIAWYLQIGILEALVMDISFAIFFIGYGLIFNWIYDRLFPLPEWQREKARI